MGWMQACRGALALMSKARDEPLTRWERVQLGIHRRLCGDCREAQAQLAQLDAAAHDWLAGCEDGRPPPQR